MDISFFLAKFWGFYLIIFFLVLSFNPQRIRDIFEYLKDPKFLLITAFIAIIVGLLNILFHNVWTGEWPIIITFLGWISIIIGIVLFMFPIRSSAALQVVNVKLIQVLYLVLFLVGVFLLNMGYGILPY
ncbi:membrane associated rhomboid family serine protease [Saonia flava]|uniref:Membrane associated rhomboid family serine protease n=1 Tax=Saonia flava TaxID=523696 RepID=A0A846QMZ7_9FLAO|nr:hypothetical protein [Saonia flava]NJB70396.1 membrane associated rhomboid family serine protease [Saonia flava]